MNRFITALLVFLLGIICVCGCRSSEKTSPSIPLLRSVPSQSSEPPLAYAPIDIPPPPILLVSYTKEEKKEEEKKAGEELKVPELAPMPRIVVDPRGNPEVRHADPVLIDPTMQAGYAGPGLLFIDEETGEIFYSKKEVKKKTEVETTHQPLPPIKEDWNDVFIPLGVVLVVAVLGLICSRRKPQQ